MLKFIDMLEGIHVILKTDKIDYIEHTLEGIKIVDMKGKTYLTGLIIVEDE